MADQLSLRGGTTTEHATFTGANKEVTVDTTKKTLVVNDGATVGGHPLMRENASNSALALGSAGTPSLKFTGDTNTGIYSPGADQVAISTNGTQRLVVDSNGKLSVTSATAAVALITGPANAYIDFTDGTGIFRTQLSSNTPVIGAASNHGLIFTTNSTERLRINPAGLVGVGTSTPVASLQIGSAGSTGSSAATNQLFGDYSTSAQLRLMMNNTSNYFGIGTNGGSSMIFGTSAANAGTSPTALMTLTSGGSLGIGTSAPSSKLEIGNGAVTAGVANGSAGDVLIGRYGSNFGPFFKLSTNNTDGNNGGVSIFTATSASLTEKVRIDSIGRLLVGTSSSGTGALLEVDGRVTGTSINSVQETFTTTSTSAVVLTNTVATGAGVIVYLFSGSSTSVAQAPGAYLIGRETTGASVTTLAAHPSLTSFTCDGTTGQITITPNTASTRVWKIAFTKVY